MAFSITAHLRCDRCEVEQDIVLNDCSQNPRFSYEAHEIIRQANEQGPYGWSWLDEHGRAGTDLRFGPRKLFCSACADAYKEHLKAKDALEKQFLYAPRERGCSEVQRLGGRGHQIRPARAGMLLNGRPA